MYKKFLKRVFDCFLSLLLLLLLLFPLVFILSFSVYFKLGVPVFFVQKRPGFREKPFKMIKFRSMTNEKDNNGILLPNEKRTTRFGTFLRKTSLDELPALINVIKGDMSLVGPRPLLMEYLPYYTDAEKKRHMVRPGITGWAQVNGRNALSWEEKFELDLWYIENQNLLVDLRILVLTVIKVFKREGIQHNEGEYMPRFDEYRK